MSEVLPEDTILIPSLIRYLGSTRLSCRRIASDSSFLGKTISYTVYEHSRSFLSAFFFYHTPKWRRYSIDPLTVRIAHRLDDIWLHIDSSIGEDRVGSRHLEECEIDPLSERHSKKLSPRPLLIGVDMSKVLAIECDIGLAPESEVFDIFMKE